ncbi:MAG: di-heme-cytochrome C peroxidase [Methylococcaceae bacterium]|jgi:hypothetical protein
MAKTNSSFILFIATLFVLLSSVEAASIKLDQGADWTELRRRQFYSVDQGSRLIKYSWIKALRQDDGRPFLAESLSRYGYLPNSASPQKLPIGFQVSTDGWLGITCSACHTRQIEVNGNQYRVDGGPALADFQRFLADLDRNVARTLADPVEFMEAAKRVRGVDVAPDEIAGLKEKVTGWYIPYHEQMSRSLPNQAWGPGRLDAVSMIFNRLSGLDIGAAPTFMIPENMEKADAPTRYPFVWNASKQDTTQWPGFAANGDDLFALLRNQGEVIGVFANFHPLPGKKGVDYKTINSTSFKGLNKAEELIKKIGPPKWPWPVDKKLAEQGKSLYEKHCGAGCHEIKKGAFRLLNPFGPSWATPIQNVGTDVREYKVLTREVNTGVLAGEQIPFLHTLGTRDTAFNVLEQAAYGSLMSSNSWLSGINEGLSLAFKAASVLGIIGDGFKPKLEVGAYEARVLQGIWAAAPYLHNGSVPTLAELLKPANERISEFKIGPAYDIVNIGLAVDQPSTDEILITTDCSDLDSGASRCGHEFGTNLTNEEKRALLEYLKAI